jgi:hypothetical protein
MIAVDIEYMDIILLKSLTALRESGLAILVYVTPATLLNKNWALVTSVKIIKIPARSIEIFIILKFIICVEEK